jgi:branched-chain amino acid transport system permease protein
MLQSFLGIAFDGLAYGSLLFLISVGLSVTLGLMNVINLAHGAFAMLGGYLASWLIVTHGASFVVAVPVAVAAATYAFGPAEQLVVLPGWLKGQISVGGVQLGTYRLFLIALVVLLTAALRELIEHTRFGARVRAAVDNPRVAAGVGIPVERVFSLTFALGSGLAGLGGALGIDVLGLQPTFALEYLVYFLLVVVVGGAGSMSGTALGALLLGVADVAGGLAHPRRVIAVAPEPEGDGMQP